jgi:hypothetical protein
MDLCVLSDLNIFVFLLDGIPCRDSSEGQRIWPVHKAGHWFETRIFRDAHSELSLGGGLCWMMVLLGKPGQAVGISLNNDLNLAYRRQPHRFDPSSCQVCSCTDARGRAEAPQASQH